MDIMSQWFARGRQLACLVLVSLGALTNARPCVAAPSETTTTAHDDLARYVNPLIGSDAHGHVFVGANVPFGAVQVGPNNVFQGWDWTSGYHYSDDIVVGFSHLHLSGTGVADLGDVVLMPHVGEFAVKPGEEYDPEKGYAARYSHDRETARAGYYSVELEPSGVRVELTATERVGFHRYTFPKEQPAQLVLDLHHGVGEGRVVATRIRKQNATTLVGRRFSSGWAKDQRAYFAVALGVEPERIDLLAADGAPAADADAAVRAVLHLPADTHELLVKVGISPVSETNAQLNVATEIPHWEFGKTAAAARAKWNEALAAIKIETPTESHKRTFYTALYHAMFFPCLHNDANGDYRGADRKVHRGAPFAYYSVLSLWDTYRAEHPLLAVVQPQRVDDFVNTMLAIHDEQGKLPVWHLMGCETNTMIGYSAVPVIADAYLKGFRGFDAERAMAAMKSSALADAEGLDHIKERGYIPADSQFESVAKGLEYAIDDSAIAAMARRMGRSTDADLFAERASYYRNYFDPAVGFMRGKLADGSWRTPFDPASSTHRKDDYCEGNAWQYTWLVPHDAPGLIQLLGGPDAFAKKLDGLFAAQSELADGASADISGMIGQYAHGNEPGHHIPYLYSYAGQQHKTAARVREILTTMYDDTPAGLCGNEDCGQMSAWYVFSALGFYPVDPTDGGYVLGSPLVHEATIRLPGGKAFRVAAKNNAPENKYIQSATLNGKPFNEFALPHAALGAGGELSLVMGPQPNPNFGIGAPPNQAKAQPVAGLRQPEREPAAAPLQPPISSGVQAATPAYDPCLTPCSHHQRPVCVPKPRCRCR